LVRSSQGLSTKGLFWKDWSFSRHLKNLHR
jgi:hypothetical protein